MTVILVSNNGVTTCPRLYLWMVPICPCNFSANSFIYSSCIHGCVFLCNHHRFTGSHHALQGNILAGIKIIPLQIKEHFFFRNVLAVLWEAYTPFLSHSFAASCVGKWGRVRIIVSSETTPALWETSRAPKSLPCSCFSNSPLKHVVSIMLKADVHISNNFNIILLLKHLKN